MCIVGGAASDCIRETMIGLFATQLTAVIGEKQSWQTGLNYHG
jgi:hypothetical protein